MLKTYVGNVANKDIFSYFTKITMIYETIIYNYDLLNSVSNQNKLFGRLIIILIFHLEFVVNVAQ